MLSSLDAPRLLRMSLWTSACRATGYGYAAAILRTPFLAPACSNLRTYAIKLKAPRDRAITAPVIKLIDVEGNFKGVRKLSEVFREYDSSTHTLVNLTPAQDEPTCRLFTNVTLKEMETKAYTNTREKRKAGSDPSKILKECTLNWTVTEHDLLHKLDSGVSALKKGNRLDVQIGIKTKRGAKTTIRVVREQLLDKVVTICSEHGKECKKREGSYDTGIILHYLGQVVKDAPNSETPAGSTDN